MSDDIGDRIVRSREARHIAGDPHRNTFHRMWKTGRFPAPLIDAEGQHIWFASQLRQWLHELKAQQQTVDSRPASPVVPHPHHE